jgi:hypothetical protein
MLREVLGKRPDQRRRGRHQAYDCLRSVLELSVSPYRVDVVAPALSHVLSRAGQLKHSPPIVGKLAILDAEVKCLGRQERGVVQACVERHQPRMPPSHGTEQRDCLLRIDHQPAINLVTRTTHATGTPITVPPQQITSVGRRTNATHPRRTDHALVRAAFTSLSAQIRALPSAQLRDSSPTFTITQEQQSGNRSQSI